MKPPFEKGDLITNRSIGLIRHRLFIYLGRRKGNFGGGSYMIDHMKVINVELDRIEERAYFSSEWKKIN